MLYDFQRRKTAIKAPYSSETVSGYLDSHAGCPQMPISFPATSDLTLSFVTVQMHARLRVLVVKHLKCFDKFSKLLNIKYYKQHPFSGSRVVPCSGTRRFAYAPRGAVDGLTTTPKQLALN